MKMKFLLQNDKEKINNHRTNVTFAIAPGMQANIIQNQKSHFFSIAPKKICSLHFKIFE